MAVFPAATLSAYLRYAAERPFHARDFNCGHFVAGWLKIAHGIEARPEWLVELPRLELTLRCRDLSMVAYVDYWAVQIGFVRVGEMRQGDVVTHHHAMGLAVPPFSAFVGRAGMWFLREQPDGIWRKQLVY
jgi:hypothetical protein